MNSESPLPVDTRRDFVKKSLAVTFIAAQPVLLAGLVRAQGGGGSTTSTTVISEVRSFTAISDSGGPYSSELLCRSAASARFATLVSQSTYVGPTTYGSTAGLVNKTKLVTGGSDYNPISMQQNLDGTWGFTITIPAGNYTVFYWYAEE